VAQQNASQMKKLMGQNDGLHRSSPKSRNNMQAGYNTQQVHTTGGISHTNS